MQELKKQIKEKSLKGIYLFFGEEGYVLNTYLDKILMVLMEHSDRTMNLDVIEGNKIEIDSILDSIETLPFLGDQRVVVLKNLNILNTKNTVKAEELLQKLDNLPETTVLFIVEKEIDKRSKLYKKVQKVGKTVEFKRLSENELIQYIADRLSIHKKKIEKAVAKYLIEAVGNDIATIHNELEKLIGYNQGEIITKEAIDEICTKSLENRIFELVDCMGRGKGAYGISLFHDLLLMKEPPTRILYMLTRQFRILFKLKLMMNENHSSSQMASALKIPSFVLNKNMEQARRFTLEQLKQGLRDCMEAELNMKTGRMDIILSMEILIIKYVA